MKGPAARQAIDPATLIAYIDANTETVQQASPARRRRLLNGHPVVQANDGRIIRRWRSGTIEGVTVKATTSFLHRYDLTLDDFTLWALASSQRVYIRNHQEIST